MKNEELMTIGEFAKKMRVTVRTLQYYDKEGILKPSAYSEGGRRLYTNKDMVRLHQILSMKYLGFSLDEIKKSIITINTPQEVKKLLDRQVEVVKKRISSLNEMLKTIETLRLEIDEINEVDFNKYATIIELIRQKDQNYVLIKYFSNQVLNHIADRFTKESAEQFMKKLQDVCKRINLLKEQNEKPESDKGQQIAKEWWEYMQEFSGGDMSMLDDFIKLYENNEEWKKLLEERNIYVNDFLEKALSIYLEKTNGGEI